MDINNMIVKSEDAIANNARVTLEVPRPFDEPDGFPAGRFVKRAHKADMMSFEPKEILEFLQHRGWY